MRKRQLSIGVTIALMAITAALTLTLTYQYAMNRFNQQVKNVTERQKMYAKLYQIDTKTRSKFLFDIDETKLNDTIANGYVSGLGDAYSRYLSTAECTQLQQQLNGKSVGIGIEFAMNTAQEARITRVIAGSPAAVAGVQKNDCIVAVNGQNVSDWSEQQIADALSGDNGVEVTLTVARLDELGIMGEQIYTMTRSLYDLVTVESRMMAENIGYIRIYQFSTHTDEEFSASLEKLVQSGVTALVLDLRNNGGGTLESAANILNQLLPAGNLMYAADADGKKTVLYTSDSAQSTLPLNVLINENTASAAEAVAAAIRDYERGTIMGMTSYGKGTVQELYTFTDGSGLSLSTAYFVSPFGGGFHQVGITPDIRVELNYAGSLDLLSESADAQLSAAIRKLKQEAPTDEPVDDPTVSGESESGAESGAESEGTESGAQSEATGSAVSAIGMEPGCADATRA